MNDIEGTREQLLIRALTLTAREQRASHEDLLRAIGVLDDAVPSLRDNFLQLVAAEDAATRQHHAAQCVRLLQFDDIMGQILKSIASRGEKLQVALDTVATQLDADALPGAGESTLAACLGVLQQCELELAAEGHVEQASMNHGDVELF